MENVTLQETLQISAINVTLLCESNSLTSDFYLYAPFLVNVIYKLLIYHYDFYQVIWPSVKQYPMKKI